MKEEAMNKIYNLSQQAQLIDMQKQTLTNEKGEIDNALKELKPEEECYRLIGSVLVKKTYEDVKKELDERKTELDENLKLMENQENKIKEQIKELQKSFQPENK